MGIRVLVAVTMTLAAMLTACPDPTELGHKPKNQIDKAQRAVDKAEKAMDTRVDKAAKAAEAAGSQE
ncbi:MAG: hypothetical protein ABIJ09_13830 [Pseudomonadota bacterium]